MIKVIGCGGGGGNAVNRMIGSGLQVRRRGPATRLARAIRTRRRGRGERRGKRDDAFDGERADASD